MKKLDELQIRKIRALRQFGSSFAEIAALEEIPTSTVVYYASSTKIDRNGRNRILRALGDAIAKLQPGDFPAEPPLPSGVIAKLQEIGEKK